MKTLFIIIAAIALTLSAAHANTGIAVYVAPEAGSGICFGNDGEKVIACARQKCAAESEFGGDDCVPALWCYPMRWTVDIFLQHREGIHWHEYTCGLKDEAALKAALDERCQDEFLIECLAVQIWTPEGKTVELNQQ